MMHVTFEHGILTEENHAKRRSSRDIGAPSNKVVWKEKSKKDPKKMTPPTMATSPKRSFLSHSDSKLVSKPRLPGEPKDWVRRRSESQLDSFSTQGGVYTDLSLPMVHKLMERGKYPVYLDFSSDRFNLKTDEFFNHCPPGIIKECDLSNNELEDFSYTAPFSNLKRLWISNNRLSSISLVNLASLKLLCLSYNRIEILPDMSDLYNLVHLDLGHNNLVGNFSELGKLKSLVYLDLSYNSLDLNTSEFYYGLIKIVQKLSKLRILLISAGNELESRTPRLREFLVGELPFLAMLDGQPVTREERTGARKAGKRRIHHAAVTVHNSPQNNCSAAPKLKLDSRDVESLQNVFDHYEQKLEEERSRLSVERECLGQVLSGTSVPLHHH